MATHSRCRAAAVALAAAVVALCASHGVHAHPAYGYTAEQVARMPELARAVPLDPATGHPSPLHPAAAARAMAGRRTANDATGHLRHEHGHHGHDHHHDHDHKDEGGAWDQHAPMHKHDFKCGLGDPRLADRFDPNAAIAEPQKYHDIDHPEVRRRLDERIALHGEDALLQHEALGKVVQRHQARRAQVSQDYDTGPGGFLSLAAAAELGLERNIRVVAAWEPVDGGDWTDGTAFQCITPGQMVNDIFTNTATYTCTSDDIVTDDKRTILEARTNHAMTFYGQALAIKPVQNSITMHQSIVDKFRLDTVDGFDATYEDADLVLIMTARPAENLNGYAICEQRDQYGRCTVGHFNWVPTVISTDTSQDPDAISAQRHTALHEIIHVLGGISPGPIFIDDDGAARPFDEVWDSGYESADYPKTVTKIKTERVLEVARSHFGCDAIDGVPIEDQPTGMVAHWEARIFGPELMSYGTGTGETIFSDITFAYLEDTNQYLANYSMGGRLVPGFGDTGRQQSSAIEVSPTPGFEPVNTHGPGALRWGRGAGCAFVTDSVEGWAPRYKCTTAQEFACTPDFRMSAVCTILTPWALRSDGVFTCGDCLNVGTGGFCSPTCNSPFNDNCVSGSCGLPSMFQYFTDAQANEAFGFGANGGLVGSLTGGFSSAMDFAPVRLGYWNCQDSVGGNGSSLLGAEAGTTFSLGSSLAGATDNMKLFGGQAYCPGCRCFVSSLMDFTSGQINPNFPRFGLCYRANCYRSDYLQFAIESQVGRATTWYKCPQAGGKLYIAGFSGAFHCPEATEFCELETVTGIKYQETDPFLEWIILASVAGLPLLCCIVCCCPCCRRRCVNKARDKCGVNHFDRRGKLLMDGEIEMAEETAPPRVPGKVLMGMNGFTLLMAVAALMMTGAGVASGRVSIAAAFLVTFSLTVIAVSLMGMCAGCQRSKGVSCMSVTYLYAIFFTWVGFHALCLYALSYSDSMGRIIERQWPKISETTPEGLFPETLDEGGGAELLSKYALQAFVLGLVLSAVLCTELWAIVKVVTVPVLAASMFTVISWVTILFGFVFWAGAALIAVGSSGTGLGGTTMVIGFFVAEGVYSLIVGTIGLKAANKKTVRWLSVSMCFSVITMFHVLVLALLMFTATRNIEGSLQELSDDQVGALAMSLGFKSGSRADVVENLKNNVRTVGMFGMCIVLMACCMVASNWFFLERVRRYHARKNKGQSGNDFSGVALSDRGGAAAASAAAHGGHHESSRRSSSKGHHKKKSRHNRHH